jgi:MoaA/NifB/PqqE/SkfB family radical SAM enzyme
VSRVAELLRKVPQYTRMGRHLRSVLLHGTPRKWLNLAHAESERKMRAVRVRSRPYLLIVDPCNYCNLRCPLCPTGLNDLGRPQGMLSLEDFRRYLDPHAPYLFEVYLHNWGESLLNKDVYQMIEHAQSRNVGTNLSSNLVALDSADLDRIIDSGLEYLVVSLDGATSETYSQYRVRGIHHNVMQNLAELIRRRRARRRRTPVIEWQFIVMKHNEHEIPAAEGLARKLGVDRLRFIPVGVPYDLRNRRDLVERWFPPSRQGEATSPPGVEAFARHPKPGPCFYLYRSMVVNPDGGVSPCCEVYRKDRDFAALPQGTIDVRTTWNNAMFRSARSRFSVASVEDRVPTVCDGCDIFEPHASKARLGESPAPGSDPQGALPAPGSSASAKLSGSP